MFPAQEGKENTDIRTEEMKIRIPKEVEMSELGKRLVGLESWKGWEDK